MDKNWGKLIHEYLVKTGMNDSLAAYLNLFLLLLAVLILVGLLDFLIWKVLRLLSVRVARKSKTNFDNFLVANKVPRFIAHIIPLVVFVEFIPVIFVDFPYAREIAVKLLKISGIILTLIIVKNIFKSVNHYLKTVPRFKDKPMDSYLQVFMIVAWAIGFLTVFAVLTNTTVWNFLTALGAASAVILLIFKDSILGLVASIQVSINDMVRIGDWVTFEKFGADGNIVEITLATVKVQNFDKTITTIPTYALISDSFKNWRGMEASGGRRIKRSIIITQKSVRFLTDEDIASLKKVQLIAPYLESQGQKIDTYNQQNGIDKELPLNGRNLTNIGVFRKYAETYLNNHSAINKKMTLMVRQLSPTPQGIPLEIYAFSADKRWVNYEYITADIFDHLMAAIGYFDLEIFELPNNLSTVSSNEAKV